MKTASLYFLLVAVLSVTFLIYRPGLTGGFTFDDIPNLLRNDAVKISELNFQSIKNCFFSGSAGPGGRPISMLSFGLNYYAAGGYKPYAFKLVNVLIHLLNGIGIFWLSRCLLSICRKTSRFEVDDGYIAWLSLTVAAVWLWHPLNLTSVLYVVQRMTSLASLFMIAALICYCRGRLELLGGNSRNGKALVLASLLFVPLAYFSKENGILIPLFLAAIELSLLRFSVSEGRDKAFLRWFFGGAVVTPLVVALGFLIFRFDWLIGGYEGRDFTWLQRLLTESRVICFYLYLIMAPNIRAMGLFHDDIALSHGLLNPVTTLFSIVAIVGGFMLAWRKRHEHPLILLAILGFLAGHSLESSIFALEIAHEHRNYFPQFFILLALVFYGQRGIVALARPRLGYTLATALLVAVPLSTAARVGAWGEAIDLITTEAANHPNSAITQFEAGSLYDKLLLKEPARKEEFYRKARWYFEKSLDNDPKFLASLFALMVLSNHAGQPVDHTWIDRLSRGLKEFPLSANTINALVEFSRCQQDGNCSLPVEDMGRLFQAAIDNPKLNGRNRAIVLSCASDYLFLVAGNYQDAVRLAYWAIESDSKELQYRINLINMLILLNEEDTAKAQLELTKKMDVLNLFKEKTVKLEAML